MLTEEVRQIQERAARRMPDPWEVENLCESWLEQSATIVLLREALERIQEQQPKTLAMIKNNGFVFEDIGADPGNWQHLAFSIYTDLCEVESISRQALEAIPEQAGVSDSKMLDWLDEQGASTIKNSISSEFMFPFQFTNRKGWMRHFWKTHAESQSEPMGEEYATLRAAITAAMQSDGAALGSAKGANDGQ